MVSRQEAARPLMIPGEVMQLPADEALVMLSGMQPIRAKKLRYFEDGNFTSHCLEAPQLSTTDVYSDTPRPRKHDWLPVKKRVSRELQRRHKSQQTGEAVANEGGLKQEPTLFDHDKPEAHRDKTHDLASLNDDFVTDLSNGDALSNSQNQTQVLRRAHAINNDGRQPDLLPEF